jgi:uncharacterized protein HemX
MDWTSLGIGFCLGAMVGLGFGLWLAHRAATSHVKRVSEAVKRAETVTDEAMKTASQAHRVSLHVSDQYAPLRKRLEDVEREIDGLKQQVHALIHDLPPPELEHR